MKNSGLNTCMTRIIFEIHLLSSKTTLKANKCEERAVAWKWPPLLVTSPHGVTLWTKKHWRLALFVFASVFEKSSKWKSTSFAKIGFFLKVEMMLQFHKLENFLSLFISIYSVIGS